LFLHHLWNRAYWIPTVLPCLGVREKIPIVWMLTQGLQACFNAFVLGKVSRVSMWHLYLLWQILQAGVVVLWWGGCCGVV
jgi:hypothetical protein